MERRFFSKKEKKEALSHQEYMCGGCGKSLWRRENEARGHHIVPWCAGGATQRENLVVLCLECHPKHDKNAMRGTIYGGYSLSDADKSQIRSRGLFSRFLKRVKK